MAKLISKGKGDINSVCTSIIEGMTNDDMGCELIEEESCVYCPAEVRLLVLEQNYRHLSLIIQIVGYDGYLTITSITCRNVHENFKFTRYTAEDELLLKLEDILYNINFITDNEFAEVIDGKD